MDEGGVAQLAERPPCKRQAAGSNPASSTRCPVNSVARVPACLAGSRGFDSRTGSQCFAEIAQTVERRVEGACVGGSKPSLGTSSVSLAQLDQSAGLRSRRSHVQIVHETPRCRAGSSGRAAASKAAGSRFDPVARRQSLSRRRQAAEGIWLQPRRRKPASVRIGPSSPCLVSSADQSSRPLPGGSAVRIGHEAPVFRSPIAQLAERLAVNQEVRGSKPRRGASNDLA